MQSSYITYIYIYVRNAIKCNKKFRESIKKMLSVLCDDEIAGCQKSTEGV